MEGRGSAQGRLEMRRANRLLVGSASATGTLTIRCECGTGCGRWLSVPWEAYESARSRNRFVMAPGHATLDDDRVMVTRREYEVVEAPRAGRS